MWDRVHGFHLALPVHSRSHRGGRSVVLPLGRRPVSTMDLRWEPRQSASEGNGKGMSPAAGVRNVTIDA